MKLFRSKKNVVKAASPKEIRAGLQEHLDYWDRRILAGDPLFDQWMADAYKATKEALAAMDKLEDAGIDTGKDEIVSSLERVPSSIVLQVQNLRGFCSYSMVTLFNGIRTEFSGSADSEQKAVAAVYALAEKYHPGVPVTFEGVKESSGSS